MLTLVLSDIFARTQALETLVAQLPGRLKIIDPYNDKAMQFEDEAAAYAHFIRYAGIDRYTEMLNHEIRKSDEPVQLLGFSVGASACWRAACDNSLSHVESAICFYGSQIRHDSNLSPKVKTTLVLPKSEVHFDVSALAQALALKANLQLVHTDYLHGFMNQHSLNFNRAAYEEYTQWLKSALAS